MTDVDVPLRIDSLTDDPSSSNRCFGLFILLNIPIINYHPMTLLPSIASYSSIADHLSKPLPTVTHQRIVSLIGANPTFDTLASATTTSVDPSATVAPTLVATTVDSLTAVVDPTSASVPSLHPNLVPLDTGASISRASDFSLEVTQASYGLIRSPISVVSKVVSTPTDPCTLITGEDPTFEDSDSVDTVEFASTLVYSSFRQFGTATLVFLSDANSKLITILVEPTQVDWIHWVPLPRLTPTESYFHIFGRDYLQAFALFHLIPIWIALVSALLRSE